LLRAQAGRRPSPPCAKAATNHQVRQVGTLKDGIPGGQWSYNGTGHKSEGDVWLAEALPRAVASPWHQLGGGMRRGLHIERAIEESTGCCRLWTSPGV
jgi:hypothetical protein